jgi:hypothetical protein
MPIFQKFNAEKNLDQTLEASISLASGLEELLNDEEQPLLLGLLKGITVNLKLDLWDQYADALGKALNENEISGELMPLLLGVSPALITTFNGELDIKIKEQHIDMLKDNEMLAPGMIPAKDLVSSTSKVSDDDELEETLKDA